MLIQADAAQIPLPDKSVHTVVTSPPYWGLRKYLGEQGCIWGGNPDCEHEWEYNETKIKSSHGLGKSTLTSGAGLNKRIEWQKGKSGNIHNATCQLCNAWYGGLGLEPTPDLYVQHIVEIMADVHRVLRDDGVVWLNMGDSFSGSGKGAANYDGPISAKQRSNTGSVADGLPVYRKMQGGNLMLMPHRIAIALQDWGWIVRNDVVWWKRNPMPESVAGWRFERERKKVTDVKLDWREESERRQQPLEGPGHIPGGNTGFKEKVEWEYGEDYELRRGSWRHTRAHEYVFMLTKKMQYWSNQEAVRERLAESTLPRLQYKRTEESKWLQVETNLTDMRSTDGARANLSGRNPRSVLDVPTAPYKGSHYATFPPNLIAPLIMATCPRWACPVCGQGWSPVIEKGKITSRGGAGKHDIAIERHEIRKKHITRESIVHEYRPTCECEVEHQWIDNGGNSACGRCGIAQFANDYAKKCHVPGIVLDPFVGSGTTVMVAKQLMRRAVGVDISMEYLDEQAKVRTGLGNPSKQLDGLPMFEINQ